MSTEYKRVRDYEMMVIFHPELSEEDVTSEVQRVGGNITSVEGTIRLVNRETPWGRRRLAYPIRHGGRDVRDGIYVLYYFEAESGRLVDIEREIKLDDRIIRYLLTQQTTPIMEPTPVEEEGAEQPAAIGTGAVTAVADASAEPVVAAETAQTVEATAGPVDATEAAVSAPAESTASAPEEVAEVVTETEPVAEDAPGEELEVATAEASGDTADTEVTEATEETPA
jgi:small subunit ribosomal protein S6